MSSAFWNGKILVKCFHCIILKLFALSRGGKCLNFLKLYVFNILFPIFQKNFSFITFTTFKTPLLIWRSSPFKICSLTIGRGLPIPSVLYPFPPEVENQYIYMKEQIVGRTTNMFVSSKSKKSFHLNCFRKNYIKFVQFV